MQRDLTTGSVYKVLVRFSLPYLLSCFLQSFYGLADLFITGQFNGASAISAVSIGSQVMHMLTIIIVGLAMGTTVSVSRALGARDQEAVSRNIGNSVSVFLIFAAAATVILILSVQGIISVLSTPAEAVEETRQYLLICFIGVPFITAYNVISSIFRGLGDTKSPMCFVFIAGVINIALDYVLIGPFHMGAAGAALATVVSQTISVLLALAALKKQKLGIAISRQDLFFEKRTCSGILKIGVPIACQDGLIQVAFLVITVIANQRGVVAAAAVGIVEKIISFLFLVPSAMLSSVSAIAAQNAGAGRHDRGRQTLKYAIMTCLAFGILVMVICELWTEPILGLFTRDEPEVIRMGCQYLRSYVFDCVFAGVHFCFSGYFCAYGKSLYSFIHNIASIMLVRIPGAYLASVLFPATLFPMGIAAPAGSLLSALICIVLYRMNRKNFNLS